MLKRFLKRSSLLGLLFIAMGIAGGCVTDEIAENADFVLAELSKTSAPTGDLKSEGATLIYASDVPDLVSHIGLAQLESDKKDLVLDYLKVQEQINCILDDVEAALEEDTTISCDGKIVVAKEGRYGLLNVSELLDQIDARDGDVAKREYLTGYLGLWAENQVITHVQDSLAQIQRTNAIPLFGNLVRTIHRFPILYEGEILVPREDIPLLLDVFRTRHNDEDQRATVREYFEK